MSIKKILVFLLIFALNYAPLAPCFAGEKTGKVKVAFAGVKCDGVPEEVCANVQARVLELLEQESTFDLLKPREVEKRLGVERLAQFLNHPDSAAFRALAADLQVDHLFAGSMANQSRDHRVLLVGALERYDRAEKILNKFEVLKYYDNFGVELLKFRDEFVKTIVVTNAGKNKSLPFIVLGSVTVVGLVALILSSSREGSQGSGGIPPPETP
jgi:hypothetical protein